MQVKVKREFLDVPVGTIGTITQQDGKTLEKQTSGALWISFPGKDQPVGIQGDGAGYVEFIK